MAMTSKSEEVKTQGGPALGWSPLGGQNPPSLGPPDQQTPTPVADVNLITVGTSPAVAMGNYYIATSTALSHAAALATSNMQQAFEVSQAATIMGVRSLYADARIAREAAMEVLNQIYG